MSFRNYVLRISVIILLVYGGCKESPTEPTSQPPAAPAVSVIYGTVRDSINNPIAGAIIADQGPLALTDTSNADGSYRLQTSLTSNYSTSLVTILQGYFSDTSYVTFEVGRELLNSDPISLRRNYTEIPPTTSGVPAKIRLEFVDRTVISAQGIGGVSSASVTFRVFDNFGRPLSALQQDTVIFSLRDTSGDTYIIPEWAITDNNGKVSATLYAGQIYSTPSITALLNTGTNIILSDSVPIRISGPYLPNFGITLSRKNLPGLSQMGVSVGDLKMQIGDQSGNPVQSGSVVYFTTNGGMVDQTARTAIDGSAGAKLYGGALPIDPVLGPGYGYVTAQVRGDSGRMLVRTLPFLFSGEPVITVPAYPTSILPTINDGGGTGYVTFIVADSNGNPISGGNNITVSCEGEAAAEMGLAENIYIAEDTWDTTKTYFRFIANDNQPLGGKGGRLRFKITVTGDAVPQGGAVVKVLESYLLAPGVVGGSGSGYTKMIYFVDPLSKRSIYVRGTDGTGGGRNETATLVFEARDSLGRTVDADHSALMLFEFVGDSLGAEITIRSALTDPSGRVTTLVRAGNQAGVPVVRAYTVVNGQVVQSDLVSILISSSFPDQRHFSISAQQHNFPGLQVDHLEDFISVRVGDIFGNPVPEGIPVWFSASHGVIETREAYTDKVGYTGQRLFSANPRPEGAAERLTYGPRANEDGYMYVRAWTRGEGGSIVRDSMILLWSGKPIDPFDWGVTRNGVGVANPDTFTVPHQGSVGSWTFYIMDRNQRPLSAGTRISISAAGGNIAGVSSVTLPDVLDGGPGITQFTVSIVDANQEDHDPVLSALVVSVVHPVYGERNYTIAEGVIY